MNNFAVFLFGFGIFSWLIIGVCFYARLETKKRSATSQITSDWTWGNG